MRKAASIWRDLGLTAAILGLSFLAGLWLQHMALDEQVNTTVVFGVFLISMVTQGYFWGVAAAFIGTLMINYAFTFPYFQLDFIIPTNLYSAIVMIVISVLTSTLTTKVKHQEAVKAESRLERMRANLMRAVSHDLRTPLTTIYGSATALLDEGENMTDDQRRTILKGIKADAEWLTRMVENLLSVTRIDAGQLQIQKVPTVLEELIDESVRKFKSRYPDQELELRLPEELVLIPMDPMLICQVIINLLENGVQHARGMTRLSLEARVAGDEALFQVTDDGCGIPPEDLERIFTGQHHRQEPTADGRKRNFGIGLSVCATIIAAHQGRIWAETPKGGGARFCFTLGLEEQSHEQ